MSRPFSQRFRLQVTVLSPLHVSDGRGVLVEDVDFIRDRGEIILIDPSRLWEHLGPERIEDWSAVEFRLSDLLKPQDCRACARAVIPYVGHTETGTGLLELIHDPAGRPFLPGSSLKGAIRTALLRVSGTALDGLDPNARRTEAGRVLEKAAFGQDPNHDLLRTLRIGDSEPLDPAIPRVFVVATYSLRGNRLEPKGQGYRLNVIALPPHTSLTMDLQVDHWTLGQAELGLTARTGWLERLAARCNQAARVVIEAERAFYTEAGCPALVRFYDQLARSRVLESSRSFLLPVGWGTGWLAKTIGPPLRDAPGFAAIRARYHLGRTGAPFPKSRRLVESAPDRPEAPLGWVQVRLNENE
ncbi:MAG: type III-A CRISPR-associated RAMP protein Csm5 [Chloroflexi bacterium]|nr:type III-A CRISPR-associated RAMP protein Csm5 [Chloroflexota bacterium]